MNGPCTACFIPLLHRLRVLLERVAEPVVLLLARLFVAHAFFASGMIKLNYILNDQWDTLIFLFEDYNVPLLPVSVAAVMGTAGEVGFSALLASGLFARLGALGLIGMSGVIYLVDHNALAAPWALLCAVIVVRGAGVLSLDALLWRWIGKNRPSER